MSQERLILAIGRMERALSRLEQVQIPSSIGSATDDGLADRHERLKAEARAAISDIDGLIAGGAS